MLKSRFLKKLFKYFHIYGMLVAQYLKTRMQYRADFYISTIGVLFRGLAGIGTLWILFKSIPDLSGWTFYELLFMYSFSLLALAPVELFFANVWSLHSHLIEGTFIKYYLKPMNMMFYYFSEVLDIKVIGQIVFSVGLIIHSASALAVKWTLLKILMMLIFYLSASLIMVSIYIMSAATGFWILNSTSILNFVSQLYKFSQYPVSIFNNFLRFLLTFIIPFGFVAYYPILTLLRDGNLLFVLIAPFVGVVLFGLAYIIWNRGVRIYTGAGS